MEQAASEEDGEGEELHLEEGLLRARRGLGPSGGSERLARQGLGVGAAGPPIAATVGAEEDLCRPARSAGPLSNPETTAGRST